VTAARSLLGLVVVTPFFMACTVMLVAKPCPATIVGFAAQVWAVWFYGSHFLAAQRRDRAAVRSIDEPEPRP
jgi:hypothetical protein